MKIYVFSVLLIMSQSYAMEYNKLSPLHKMLYAATIFGKEEEMQFLSNLVDDHYFGGTNSSPEDVEKILKQYSEYLDSLQEDEISSYPSETPFDSTESVNPLEEETLSSGSESISNGDEENDTVSGKYVSYTRVDKSGTKVTQEPIEAFFRRTCPECSVTIADPSHAMPAYQHHWKEKHPGIRIQYDGKIKKPSVFYELFTLCPLHGEEVNAKHYKEGTCTYYHSNEKATLEIAGRIPEFVASHCGKIHNKLSNKHTIAPLLEISCERRKNASLKNKKQKIH